RECAHVARLQFLTGKDERGIARIGARRQSDADGGTPELLRGRVVDVERLKVADRSTARKKCPEETAGGDRAHRRVEIAIGVVARQVRLPVLDAAREVELGRLAARE